MNPREEISFWTKGREEKGSFYPSNITSLIIGSEIKFSIPLGRSGNLWKGGEVKYIN